jgi:hypothetical protein
MQCVRPKATCYVHHSYSNRPTNDGDDDNNNNDNINNNNNIKFQHGAKISVTKCLENDKLKE